MRIKDYDLNLADENKVVVEKEVQESLLESYYHMGANCSLYNIDGVKFLLFLEDFENLVDSRYLQKKHIVEADEIGRIDRISYKYYNTPELFWLILQCNPQCDPFEMYEGQELVIPDLQAFDNVSLMKDTFVQTSDRS